MWQIDVESLRKCIVSFNMAIRKVLGFIEYESVRQLRFDFGVISFDLIVLKAKLRLTGIAEKSERPVIRRCAELTINDELFHTIINDYCMEYDMNKQSVASISESV